MTNDELTRLRAERDRAVASVAALLHAYIGITPGATVGGLAPEVQAEAERLLEERLALESERDNLRDECNALRAALEGEADYCLAQLKQYAKTADSSGEDDPLYHAALCFHYMQLEKRLRAVPASVGVRNA